VGDLADVVAQLGASAPPAAIAIRSALADRFVMTCHI
jgi:hypothetical protein